MHPLISRTIDPMTDPITASADALIHARRTHTRVHAAALPPLPDAQAAYAVQAAVARALAANEHGVARHWKSGGASRNATPTHAPLPDAGIWSSPADARPWPLHWRGIEAEIALRLGRDVSPERAATLDADSAAALVDAMCVSIEIVDSRWAEALDAPPLAKLADLQSHGALVLGAWLPFTPRDWTRQRCRVCIGTRPPHDFTGTHSMADPAFVLPAWLRHATRDGATVPAGTVVTTGTWCGILPAQAGDLITAEFHGIGSAAVQL
jgi:2-keto-4-pentenoate hydratase